MGSYDDTCLISGLPIHCGDAVRYILLTQNTDCRGTRAGQSACYIYGRWFPRVLPLRGYYDDYGGVDELTEGPQQELWARGFREDMVEHGTGDNPVHDGAVTKATPLAEILERVSGGGVCVREAWGMNDATRKLNVPKGVPTRRRVAKLLEEHGIKVAASTDDGPKEYVHVNRCGYGQARVRRGTYAKDEILERAATVLGKKYATMIRGGTGNHASELIVAPRPGVTSHRPLRESKTPLAVAHGMIREDVWRALVDIEQNGDEGYHKLPTVETATESFLEAVKDIKDTGEARSRFGILSSLVTGHGFGMWIKTPMPFAIGTGESWMWMAEMAAEGKVSQEEIVDFVTTAVEFVRIQRLLATVRYAWRPTGSGPQFGDFSEHARFLGTLARVATHLIESEDGDENEADESPEGDGAESP